MALCCILNACGGSDGAASGPGPGTGSGGGNSATPASYSLGGKISGLAAEQQVTLLNNGSDALTLSADGTFTFPTAIPSGGSYLVTVGTQPTGQTCSVGDGTGSGAGVTMNVSNVRIVCSTDAYTIGGSISGLASGTEVTLLNNGGDALAGIANGPFTFTTPVAYNGSYLVTVGTQPTGQVCSVGSGTGSGSDVTTNINSVQIVCSTNTFTISGSVSGLDAGEQVTLLNNGTDPFTLLADGSFRFATPIAYGGSYQVTIGSRPVGQSCSVSNGVSTAIVTNISDVAIACSDIPAQVTTLAGSVTPGQVDGTGAAASFTQLQAAAVDAQGNVYVTDAAEIRRISAAGVVTTLAGSNSVGSTDGTGSAALFHQPMGIAVAPNGDIYVADTDNDVIRQITPAGVVTTLAGSPGVGGSADGTGSAARFYLPWGIAVDASGTLYVSDTFNQEIRKVTPAGVVTTLAGSPGVTGAADGVGSAASFKNPAAIAVDTSGTVYVADVGNTSVRKITPDGTVTTLPIPLSLAPLSIAVDAHGSVYVGIDNRILKLSPAGTVKTLAGQLGVSGYLDGPATTATLVEPDGLAVDSNFTVYVADNPTEVRKITQ